jgi:AraC-like DNA-binding protein
MARLLPKFHIGQDFVRLSASHPVRIQEIPQINYPPHDHEFVELCIVWSGRGMHRTESGLQPLQRGSMIVMMPGQVHAFEKTSALRSTNIYYLNEWLLGDFIGGVAPKGMRELFLYQSLYKRPAWWEIPHFQLDPSEVTAVSRDLADFAAELQQDCPSQFFLRTTFWRLLFRCTRAFRRTSTLPLPQFPPDVQLLLDEIEDALCKRQPFSLQSAATHIHFSPRHAGRRFKAFVGTSIMDYFQHRRIDLACHLLLDPRQSITEIAHELGFADGAHFSRSFQAIKQRTPREFRRIYVKEF